MTEFEGLCSNCVTTGVCANTRTCRFATEPTDDAPYPECMAPDGAEPCAAFTRLEKENREIKTAYDLRGEGLNELHVRIHDLEQQRDETQRCLEGETKQRRKLEQEKAELRERLRQFDDRQRVEDQLPP